MELHFCFSNINWLSVIVAAVLAFAVGGLWYSPVLFSKLWQKELKLSDENIQNANMPLIFGTTFVLNFISAVFLDLVIGVDSCWLHGLLIGLGISVIFIATSFAINYLFARKSFLLYLIDAGYYVTYYTLMGAILGAW